MFGFPRRLSDARMNDKFFLKFFRTTDYADKTDGGLCGEAKGKRRGESGPFALGASPFSPRNVNSAVTISHKLAAVRCVSPYRLYATSESRPKNVESVSVRSGAQPPAPRATALERILTEGSEENEDRNWI